MNSKLGQQRAEQCAAEVIEELQIISLPVKPIEIAGRKNILVQPKPSSEAGVSGFLMKVGDLFGIAYATHIQNEGFINFTVGHELGHYFLPGHVDYLFRNGTFHASKSGFISNDPYEREADFFSAALLMPERLFVPALKKAGQGFAAINSLSSKCGTSLTATAIRFSQFTEDPLAVIVSSDNLIEYTFLSGPLKEVPGVVGLRRGELVPSGTPTERFHNDPNNKGTRNAIATTSSLRDWFADAPDHEVNEDVTGLGSYGKTLTILFSDTVPEEDEFDDSDGDSFDHYRSR